MDYRIEFDHLTASSIEGKIPLLLRTIDGESVALAPKASFGLADAHVVHAIGQLERELDACLIDVAHPDDHHLDIDVVEYGYADDTWGKQCSWRTRLGRDYYCGAVWRTETAEAFIRTLSDGTQAFETDMETCRTCQVPDDRLICDALTHLKMSPKRTGGPGKLGQPEGITNATCQAGEPAVSDPSGCRPGKNACWHRTYTPTEPEPPRADGMHVLEAFDFLDSAWRLRHGQRILNPTSLSEVARLADPVTSLAGFKDNVVRLGELLQKLKIHGDLIDGPSPKGSLERLEKWCEQNSIDASDAVKRLAIVNDLRNALSHTDPPKRATSLAQIGIEYPPISWSQAWYILAGHVYSALRQLRLEIDASVLLNEGEV